MVFADWPWFPKRDDYGAIWILSRPPLEELWVLAVSHLASQPNTEFLFVYGQDFTSTPVRCRANELTSTEWLGPFEKGAVAIPRNNKSTDLQPFEKLYNAIDCRKPETVDLDSLLSSIRGIFVFSWCPPYWPNCIYVGDTKGVETLIQTSGIEWVEDVREWLKVEGYFDEIGFD